MKYSHFIVFDPFVRSYVHLEGVICYHAHDGMSPSDCVWIMPGTLNVTE